MSILMIQIFQLVIGFHLTSSTSESEMLWVEIESDLDSNMICGVVYRHPSSNLETFLNNFYSVIGKINQEGKLCLISGDFNINLLKYDKHPLTEDFINTLGSFFLEPHILKPTRITSHSSTLIDNIFFNSIEYQTISGNLLHDLTDHLPNFTSLRSLLFQDIKRKNINEIILTIMKKLLLMNLVPLTGLIYFMDSQILLKCLISFMQK